MEVRSWEKKYLTVLHELTLLAKAGNWRGNRTGVRTVGGFGLQLDVPLFANYFPTLVSKTVHWKSVVAELLWFIRGETNIAFLKENGCRIWDEWANEQGELGPVYGYQWRNWPTGSGFIDQLYAMINTLRTNPMCRRMIVSAWNPAALPLPQLSPQENATMGRQALAPCHMLFQVYVEPLTDLQRLERAQGWVPAEVLADLHKVSAASLKDVLDRYDVPRRGLHLRVDQRSADWMLGVPFNIASYALLAHLLCTQVGDMMPANLVMQFGDYHLYENQVDAAEEQLKRFDAMNGMATGLEVPAMSYGQLWVPATVRDHSLHTIEVDEVVLTGYQPWGKIAAPVAV